MATSITIRTAIVEDAPIIFEFINELEACRFDYNLFRQYYEHNIRADNIYLVAVDAQNAVVGYISCHGQILLHHLGKVFEIQEMFVTPAYRSQGVGKLLILALEEILSKQDYRSLEVTTNKNRTATQEFYRKNGFTATHVKFTKPTNT